MFSFQKLIELLPLLKNLYFLLTHRCQLPHNLNLKQTYFPYLSPYHILETFSAILTPLHHQNSRHHKKDLYMGEEPQLSQLSIQSHHTHQIKSAHHKTSIIWAKYSNFFVMMVIFYLSEDIMSRVDHETLLAFSMSQTWMILKNLFVKFLLSYRHLLQGL